MKEMTCRNQSGYIALMTVLVTGAASLAIASALLLTAVDSQRTTLVIQQSAEARNLATACAEEALEVIRADIGFNGSDNLSLGQGGCTYTVTDAGGPRRVITVTGTVDSVVRKLQVNVTIETLSISVTSWQEVI